MRSSRTPRLARTLATLVACAASAAGAQTAPPADRAARVPADSVPTLGPGARVRFTFADPRVELRRRLFVHPPIPIESQVLRMDGSSMVVPVPGAGEFGIPLGNMRELGVRTGPGPCRTHAVSRVLCVGAAGLVSALVHAGGAKAAGASPTLTGAAAGFGGVLGLVAGTQLGRDRWVPVPGTASAPAR